MRLTTPGILDGFRIFTELFKKYAICHMKYGIWRMASDYNSEFMPVRLDASLNADRGDAQRLARLSARERRRESQMAHPIHVLQTD
jgi:hypothetical protein